MLRHSDGKVRHDGSRAANKQRCYAVVGRGRLHGASEFNARVRNRGVEHRMVYYRILEEERRWRPSLSKYDRLRRQDKRPHIVARTAGCFCWRFRHFSHIARLRCNVRFYNKLLIWCENLQGAEHIRWPMPGLPLILQTSALGPLAAGHLLGLRPRKAAFCFGGQHADLSYPLDGRAANRLPPQLGKRVDGNPQTQ